MALRARVVGERVADNLVDVDPEQHKVADVDPELLHGGGAERYHGVVGGHLALPVIH